MSERALIWLRRDLRLRSHPALSAALAAGQQPVFVYIHAPEEEGNWPRGAASNWWLARSLRALARDIEARGGRLIIRRGPSLESLRALCAETGATAVHWQRVYEAALTARDRQIKESLRAAGLRVESHAGYLLHEPWQLKTQAGEPYRVFSPFWRNASARLAPLPPTPAPATLPSVEVPSLSVDELGLEPRIEWDLGMRASWQPGEAGAAEQLELFIDAAMEHYAGGRDRPDRRGTSRLSPHLHFGEIAVGEVLWQLRQTLAGRASAGADSFVRELGWRDFSYHLLYHYPHTPDAPLQPAFASFPWAETDPAQLRAWQRGRTGIPIVDAGMRELWHTGWMHNRVRMIVASFLTKNLRYHWLHGARWFWDTLVDADLANNTQGWQWSAGSGADAAPYFRIFNPVAQGERFDPEGDYVRRYVPELARVPASRIHQPWTGGGVAGYPKPIIDLKDSRNAALDAYAAMRRGSESH